MADETRREPTLDRSVLDANTMADHALQTELFMLFFNHAPTNVAMCEAALAQGDQQKWRDGAHAIKGAAATLGLMRLRALALAAENERPSPARLDALRAEIEQARAAAETLSEAASLSD